VKNIYATSFDKMHQLDINYHKLNSKDTVFEINKAVSALEDGVYYLLGDVLRLSTQLVFVSSSIWAFCGFKYFAMLAAALTVYTSWTTKMSMKAVNVMFKENARLKQRENI
jgi:ABC-type transport system involved in Fe-S cluster assembly fused permease/ATPase subunit